MIRAGAGRLLALAGFAVLTFNVGAIAQSTGPQTPKEQSEHRQSTVQIVSPDLKPLEPKPPSSLQTTQQPAKPAEAANADAEPVVTPPAPIIVKKTPNTILIPAAGVSEPKFEERPAVASGISVGSSFGYRRDPFTRRAKFHSGVDIKARWGDAVGASQAGTVVFAGWYYGYGNMIVVDHGGGIATHYAHLSSFEVEVGQHVERGRIIGRAGSTGRATSPHLHYELRVDGNPINPFQTVALDSSSDYFKQVKPAANAGTAEPTAGSAASAEKTPEK